jgi:hypothetical protein
MFSSLHIFDVLLQHALFDIIDVQKARASRVYAGQGVLATSDNEDTFAVQKKILSSTTWLDNNPQNRTHNNKKATMMNDPPQYTLQRNAPSVVGKMVAFAERAWSESGWSQPGGPLESLQNGIAGLSIRVIELWEYEVGGGLIDNYHYDVDSVITIVALLSEAGDYDGGEFRTFEADDNHKVYPMDRGDAICFVSHKYHNITAITRGQRKSLVVELWQGGVGHYGR